MSAGVVVGRFQVAELTAGHRELLNEVSDRHQLLVVLIGVSPTQPNPRNPLPFYVREAMIREEYPNAIVLPLVDCMEDTVWSTRVDAQVRAVVGHQAATLYGSRDSFIPSYSGAFPTVELPSSFEESGTAQRAAWKETLLLGTGFRAGMIHAVMNQFPQTFPTVDMAVVRNGQLLVGRKAGETRVRLPGGHVDPTDYSLEAAARRELREECDVEAVSLRYIDSLKVDDWRTRGTGNGVMTALFLCDIGDEDPTAGDDLVELFWIDLASTREQMRAFLVPDHLALYTLVQNAVRWDAVRKTATTA